MSYKALIFSGKTPRQVLQGSSPPQKMLKCLEPQNIVFAKLNLCTCSKRIAAILFLLLTNPAILQASKLAKNLASFVHDRVRRGVGLFLICRHNLLFMHVYKKLIRCKSICGRNAFRTGAKIHLSEKNILG